MSDDAPRTWTTECDVGTGAVAAPLGTLRQVSDRAVIQRWWDGLGKDLRAVATQFVWAGSPAGYPRSYSHHCQGPGSCASTSNQAPSGTPSPHACPTTFATTSSSGRTDPADRSPSGMALCHFSVGVRRRLRAVGGPDLPGRTHMRWSLPRPSTYSRLCRRASRSSAFPASGWTSPGYFVNWAHSASHGFPGPQRRHVFLVTVGPRHRQVGEHPEIGRIRSAG